MKEEKKKLLNSQNKKNSDDKGGEKRKIKTDTERKLKTLFSPKKLLFWLAIIVLIFTAPQLNKEAMSKTEAIVTMMFVDKKEDKYNLAVSVLAPGQERNKNLEIYTGGGKTISEAVDSVALALGKEIGFAQCQIMGLGPTLCEEGVMQALDYMTRTKKVGRNAVLISFEGEVNEFAQAVKDINTNKNLNLDEIISFDKRYLLSQDSSIESFYIGYFSDLGLGIMPKLSLINQPEFNAIELSTGSSSSSGSSPGMSTQSASQSSQGEKTYLLNDGSTNVFIDGKKQKTLTPDIIEKVNLFVNNHQKNSIILEDVNDYIYKNATVVVDVVKKETKLKTQFKDGVPVLSAEVELTVSVEEIAESQLNKSVLRWNQDFLTKALIKKIEEKTIKDMNEFLEYCKTEQLDLVSAYKNFYRHNYKEWKAYVKEHPNFLEELKLETKVNVISEF